MITVQDYTPSPEEPDRAPRESTVVAEPATVAACARDYADAADVRKSLARQER
ncbi:hypothetical protein ACGFXC_09180 [Streptomyces sp. NPDC048507]|uniref:hypothetical protein n=1 Tax=Streptomyces sp. NPDC048507 TaxID=3365560 RepID=UPI00371AF940